MDNNYMYNQRKYDIVIPLSVVDLQTFEKNYPIIRKNIAYRNIVVISSKKLQFDDKKFPNIRVIDEDTIIDGLSLSTIKAYKKILSGTIIRSGWYFQQFLKMAYALICKADYYILWDADTIPLKPICLFDAYGKPYMDYKELYDDGDRDYFITLKRLFHGEPLVKSNQHSFITEHMVIKTSIMRELIGQISANGIVSGKPFWENIMNAIDLSYINLSGFSEFECYAEYMLKYHHEEYIMRLWNNLRCGKVFVGSNPSKEEIAWVAEKFDVMSLEDFDHYVFISKIVFLLHLDFLKYYNLILPILQMWWKFRAKIRRIVRQKLK